MYTLMLNKMASGWSEELTPVAKAETVEELIHFVASERVPDYHDPIENPLPDTPGCQHPKYWHKCFRKGGPLEWFNPPSDYNVNRHYVADLSMSVPQVPLGMDSRLRAAIISLAHDDGVIDMDAVEAVFAVQKYLDEHK